MKNYKLIIIFVGIMIILLFSSCSKETNKVTWKENGFFAASDGRETSDDNIENTTETTTENTVFYHPEVEMVIIDCIDTRKEYLESQIPFDFIDEIKKCESVPKTNIRLSIGEMKLKYKDSDKEQSFAKLYLGSDGEIYAKYNKSKNPDYAYQIDF